MSTEEDQPCRGTRLYVFPGGVFEIAESPDDVPGTGIYLEFHQPRQSDDDGPAFDLLDSDSQGPGVA